MEKTVFDENETFCILNSIPGLSLDNFDGRLRLQKIGYLAQELGASGNFMFSWYIHGPYSGRLTKMLYRADYLDRFGAKHEPSPRERNIIDKIKQLIGTDGLNDRHLLELYASVWYLFPRRKTVNDDVENVVRMMKTRKPNFKEQEVRTCIKNIKKYKENIAYK